MRPDSCDPIVERAARLVRITGCCPHDAQIRAEEEAEYERELQQTREWFQEAMMKPMIQKWVEEHPEIPDAFLAGEKLLEQERDEV